MNEQFVYYTNCRNVLFCFAIKKFPWFSLLTRIDCYHSIDNRISSLSLMDKHANTIFIMV